jgi:hypothetical protein
MKRTLSFLLTLLMLVTSLPVNAFLALAEGIVAEEEEEEAVSVESFRGRPFLSSATALLPMTESPTTLRKTGRS